MNIKITSDGNIKFSAGPQKTRLENLEKWLGRNDDALLVKLKGPHDTFDKLKVGHVCRIEEESGTGEYTVFVGDHMIGHLPDEAITFAKQVESDPEFLIAIVGKIEYGASPDRDEIYIYIAE